MQEPRYCFPRAVMTTQRLQETKTATPLRLSLSLPAGARLTPRRRRARPRCCCLVPSHFCASVFAVSCCCVVSVVAPLYSLLPVTKNINGVYPTDWT